MVIDSLGMGGAEVSLKTLSSSLVDQGHNVVVLVIRGDVVISMNANVHTSLLRYKKYKLLPSIYINAIKLRRRINKLEDEHGSFDLKIVNLTLSHKLAHHARLGDAYYCLHEDVVASNLSKRTGIKKYARKLRLKKFFNGKKIITVSDGVRDSLASIEGICCESIQTIYNPIDLESIKRLSVESNPYAGMDYIVHVGRFSSEKRHDVLLDAYHESGLGCMLLLVGDGPDKAVILNKITELHLEDKVVVTGFINNPYPIIRDANLLILSSDYEGFGVVLAEALCLETAVVSTNSMSGPSEIMLSPLSNYLVPTGDVHALSGKMQLALADVEKHKYQFKSKDLERFSPEVIAAEYVKLIQ